MTLREQIGQQLLEAVEHNVDVITDSDWFVQFIKDNVFEVMADSEWFREIVQEAVSIELAKIKQKED